MIKQPIIVKQIVHIPVEWKTLDFNPNYKSPYWQAKTWPVTASHNIWKINQDERSVEWKQEEVKVKKNESIEVHDSMIKSPGKKFSEKSPKVDSSK